MSTLECLQTIFQEQASVLDAEMTVEKMDLDSLDQVEISMEIESEFGIDLSDDDTASLFRPEMTITTMATHMEGLLNG